MSKTTTILLLLAAFALPACSSAASKPNVIVIMADDIGYECYGAYGGTSYQTPNIDRMAKNGLKFNHCYSQPLCTPSRVKIMTGLSNVRNYAAFSVLKKGETTFGHMMQKAGYRTAISGKWQLYGAEHYKDAFRAKGALPQDMGFERHCLWQVDKLGERFWGPAVTIDGELKQYPKEIYGPDVYTQFLLDRMEEYKDEPFFLYYPMVLVHGPFVPTPDSANKRSKNKQQNFADMVAYMDKLIGRIVKKTEALGIADNTLILVTGDNGTHSSLKSMMGDRVVKGGKGKSTDAGTRVALVGYQPGAIKAGGATDDLVEFSDFLPTIAAAGGAKLPGPTDGVSFLPQLYGRKATPRDSVFIYYCPRPERTQPLRFVRDQRWKLYGDGRLIDVPNDEFEKSPVSGRDAIRKRLQAALDAMPAKGLTLLSY